MKCKLSEQAYQWALGGKSPKTKLRIANPRRFYGCELKDEYFKAAKKNCVRAVADASKAEIKERPLMFAGDA